MSIEIMNAVWQNSKAEGRPRLTLLAIADHQGDIGAWPSIERLAKMVNASGRSVQRDIAYLQSIGELIVEKQNAPGSSQYKANLYWVTVPGVTNAQSGVTNAHVRGDSTCHTNHKEPLKEPNMRIELFEEFWKEYPIKKDRGRAIKAFNSALNRAKFEDILAGAILYRQDPERKPAFTKFPATWLNGDSWENIVHYPEADDRRKREREATLRFLEEEQKRAAEAKPAPLCPHGTNIVLCRSCIG